MARAAALSGVAAGQTIVFSLPPCRAGNFGGPQPTEIFGRKLSKMVGFEAPQARKIEILETATEIFRAAADGNFRAEIKKL